MPFRRPRDLQQFSEHATFVSICNICPHKQHFFRLAICPHLHHLFAHATFDRTCTILPSSVRFPSSASGCSPMLMYPGRPRPALGTPMAWHYSWHLIFLIFALRSFFLHFPSDAISSYIHVRTSFSGPRRCVCSIVSWGLTTAGTPTARCTRGGRIDSLITLRHWCWNTHGSNPIVSLEGMSQTGFLSAK